MAYNNGLFSDSIEKVIKNASKIALRFGSNLVGTEHILYGLASVTDCTASKLLASYGVTEKALFELFEESSNGISLFGNVELTPRTKELFQNAQQTAMDFGHSFIGTEHLLFAILSNKSCYATKVMENAFGVNIDEMRGKLLSSLQVNNGAENGKRDETSAGSKLPEKLLEMGSDITLKARQHKLDPVIGREEEIQRVIEILCRKTKNNPVLIGEAGVGKTAVVEGLAQAIASGDVPDQIRDKSIYALEIGGLMAGTKYRGQMEEKLKDVIETIIQDGNIIVFIDEIHTLAQAGSKEGETSPSDMLKPYLARGELQTIGATTTDEYRKYIEQDKALERRFQPVMVNPPSVEQTILILNGLKDTYEAYHKIKITDEAIRAAANLSDRYITDRSLPDKAIDLIDEACSRAKVNFTLKPQKVRDLEDKIKSLSATRDEASLQRNYEKAAKLQSEIINLENDLKKQNQNIVKKSSTGKIGENEIAEVVSKWTGIPVTKLTEGEKEKLVHLEEILHKRVVGQDQAITAVARAIRRARVGLQDGKRPIGSFLFMGPTGVGKTELSKAIAEAMFDDENNIIRIDMSEYMESHTVSKLIGSPPGYVGFEEGGQLTEQVRRRPYSVVLFDEVEKAHPEVLNALLQILDDGRLTDSKGRTISFKNTIIIMTSNIGANEIKQQKQLGFSTPEGEKISERDIYMDALKRKFKPELINRIDVICIFDALSKQDLVKITNIMLDNINNRLRAKNLEIDMEQDAIDFIVAKGSNLSYGARPLKRFIEQEIEDRIAEKILLGELKDHGRIVVAVDGDKLTFNSVE
ncbi:MAG: ATP-dependent Clp protease ATP-binding subunit [Clostridia bacterium]|nr:ATP-dependent Clp protease ATP-binding subunit [Clostridia bacterium]